MKCKYCQDRILNPDGTEPTGRAKGIRTIKHYHVAHPDIMATNLIKGRQILATNVAKGRQEKQEEGQIEEKTGKKEVGRHPTTPTLVGFNAPKPGAVMFNIGSSSLEIEPISLFEAYLLYLDMKAKCGLTDSFSTCIVDSISIAWKMMVPQLPKIKTPEDSGNGHQIGIAIG